MLTTYDEVKKYFDSCKAYWVGNGDSDGVATSKAFWWDCVEVFNSDDSWNDAKKEFAMEFRGYKVGDPVPEAEYVENGAI